MMTKQENVRDNIDIVVAHYSENIDRLKPYAKNAIVYHKWKEDKPRFPVKKWIKIDNVWREWETYLQHIINNYEDLADITIFLQWWMHDQLDNKVAYEDLDDFIKEVKKYGFSTRRTRFILKKNPQIVFNKWKFKEWYDSWWIRHANDTFAEFYEKIFWESQPLIFPCFFAANFAVTKDKIHRRPQKFYEKIRTYFIDHSNPEEWHYLERLWFKIFNDKLNFHYLIKIIARPFIWIRYHLWLFFKK